MRERKREVALCFGVWTGTKADSLQMEDKEIKKGKERGVEKERDGGPSAVPPSLESHRHPGTEQEEVKPSVSPSLSPFFPSLSVSQRRASRTVCVMASLQLNRCPLPRQTPFQPPQPKGRPSPAQLQPRRELVCVGWEVQLLPA